MAFLTTIPWYAVPSFLSCVRANQMEFEQVLHNLTFKRMTALRIKIHSVVDYFYSSAFGYMQF